MSKIGSKFHKKWPFLPLTCNEQQVMSPKEFVYPYLMSEIIWGQKYLKVPSPPNNNTFQKGASFSAVPFAQPPPLPTFPEVYITAYSQQSQSLTAA